jgi:hypothetical protein
MIGHIRRKQLGQKAAGAGRKRGTGSRVVEKALSSDSSFESKEVKIYAAPFRKSAFRISTFRPLLIYCGKCR